MKRLLFILTLFTVSGYFAQNNKPDSLFKELDKTNHIHEKIKILNKISDAYKFSDAVAMQKFAKTALKLSKRTNNKKQEILALQNLASSYIILGDYGKALMHLDQSEKRIKDWKQNDQEIEEILAKNFGSKGIIYSEKNNYSKALESDFEAIKIYEKYHNEIQISKIYNNIGVIYHSINDKDKALPYFLKSYKIQKKLKSSTLGVACSNIGMIYLSKKLPQKAKLFFDESLNEFKKNPSPRDLGELYNNISQYYVLNHQPETAKEYLWKAEENFKEIKDKFGLSNTYFFLGEIFYHENDLTPSLKFADKSLNLSKELDLPETLTKSELLVSQIYEKTGNTDKALKHLKNYISAYKKLLLAENANERIKTELSFELEKQQMEKKEKTERERIKWYFIGALLIIIMLALIIIFHKREKEKVIVLQKQLTEFQYKALHLQMNPHFLFNCLAAISAFIMQNDKGEAIKYLAKFSKLMRLTLNFSKESFITIDKEIESLNNYLELEQLRFKDKFDFTIIKDPLIEDDTYLPSLLLQAYVENSIIHGVVPKEGKGFIKIQFRQSKKSLICEITDNGIGIETSKKKKKESVIVHKSMAMEILKKRLEILEELEKKKICLFIEEIKGLKNKSEGTKITLELPLEYLKEKL